MAKLQLLHSITHDGQVYGIGVYEIGADLSEQLAQHFLKVAPKEAKPFLLENVVPQSGLVQKAPDAAALEAAIALQQQQEEAEKARVKSAKAQISRQVDISKQTEKQAKTNKTQ